MDGTLELVEVRFVPVVLPRLDVEDLWEIGTTRLSTPDLRSSLLSTKFNDRISENSPLNNNINRPNSSGESLWKSQHRLLGK